jgi:hypothetical protein
MPDSTALRRLTAELQSRWRVSMTRFEECHHRSLLLIERVLAVQHNVDHHQQHCFDRDGRYRRPAVRDAS